MGIELHLAGAGMICTIRITFLLQCHPQTFRGKLGTLLWLLHVPTRLRLSVPRNIPWVSLVRCCDCLLRSHLDCDLRLLVLLLMPVALPRYPEEPPVLMAPWSRSL